MPIIITIDLDTGKYFIESYCDGAVWATAFSRKLLNEIIARHGYTVVADYAEEVGR